ncbi:TetR/AcrR family transcriptional regulator [Microbacterium sp. ZW T5_56]|uniref:TetR/AcrR family transcriptional regulator n=1 Tax=Microbacterium sp. ZW T5_56 TaxID=3378081 RepID=UPI003853F3C4
MTRPTTHRDRAKAERRASLVTAAARLFAAHGYAAVTIDQLGTAVGISGPAVYRHFPGKQMVLEELLVGVSTRLHEGGREVCAAGSPPSETLRALVEFHTRFALVETDVIRVQDRDLPSLNPLARDQVRTLQRAYVDDWVATLRALDPTLSDPLARLRVHAVFGLLNSTPHALRGSRADRAVAANELAAAAWAALTAAASPIGDAPRA